MKAIQTTEEKIREILFKPYSEDVLGYSFFIKGCGHYFVINSNLTEEKQDNTYIKLKGVVNENPHRRFILIQKDGKAYLTDNLKLPEESDAE